MLESQSQYLTSVEEALIKVRGYVSKLPKNKKVVVVLSGGLDSVSVVARCIVDFNLDVFPISIHRGQSNITAEQKAVDYFNNLFLEEYSGKYHPVKIVEVGIPLTDFKEGIKKYADLYGYPLRDNIIESIALQYATSLWPDEGEITSIYTGIVPEDIYAHSSLQAMRSTTLMACLSTPITKWNISSINVDPFLYSNSGPFSKPDEIKWCFENNIPIHLSRTCNTSELEHCGACSSCKKRHAAFEKAGVIDQTHYLQDIKPTNGY